MTETMLRRRRWPATEAADPATRYILDDQNHDDFAAPGELPEAPVTGYVYARGNRGWHRAVPLDGGQMTGPLMTTMGSQSVPALMLGSNDSGFYRSGSVIYLLNGYTFQMAWAGNLVVSWVPLNMGNQPITALADAWAAQDALNLRTADARYGRSAWQAFPIDPGWTAVTLRYRTLDGGASLQLDGNASAPLPAQARARLGVLPAGVRPARMQRVPALVMIGITVAAALVEIESDGSVWTQWTVGDAVNFQPMSVAATIALD